MIFGEGYSFYRIVMKIIACDYRSYQPWLMLPYNRPMQTDRQPAQQPPRKEVLQIIDKLIKEHHADLEYLKDK
jgi:hypothetical protein